MTETPIPQRRYEQVAATLSAAMADGTYAIGDRLPSIQQMADEFGISHMTVKHALDVLRRDGLIASRSGTRAQVVATPGEQAKRPSIQAQIDELREAVAGLTGRLDSLEAHGNQSMTDGPDSP